MLITTKSGGTTKTAMTFFCSILLSGIALSQIKPESQPTGFAEAANEVKAGNWAYVDRIAQAPPAQAVPILHDLFAASNDIEVKERIALFLYKFGDTNGAYWDFLLNSAADVLESDAPFRYSYDSQGKMVGQSPDFIAWAQAHNTSPEAAYEETSKGLMRIHTLIRTEDARSIPILRRGLESPNPMIQEAAAMGLAELHDKDSIRLIVAACQRAPADGAALIADSLVFFDDPQAQSAADLFLPKEKAAALRDQIRAHGNKPFSNPRVQ